VGSSISSSQSGVKHFHADMPMEDIVRAMADPCNGLSRRNNTQLNLTISDSFSGQDLINWLADNVMGLEDRRACERYSSLLLRNNFIKPAFKKDAFTAFCYYTLNEAKVSAIPAHVNTMKRGVLMPIDNQQEMNKTPGHKCKASCTIKRLFCLHPVAKKRQKK
jgi:hypothetical protein